MKALSVAVAGCGPAGLATALYLHRAGHEVTLVERFDTPKPLGSGLMLQATGLGVLADLGLKDAISACGTRIARLDGRLATTGRRVLDVGYAALSPDVYGLAVHRASLFRVLHDAVGASQIHIRTGFEVAGIQDGVKGRSLVSASGELIGPFDLIIDALGSRSPLPQAVFGRSFVHPLPYGALWAALDWPESGPFSGDALEQRYEAAHIMVGVLPIGRRTPAGPTEAALFWSLKASQLDDWRRNGLEAWKADVRRIWPAVDVLIDQIDSPDQLTFARYGHHTLPRPVAPGIAFIGDCAHSASPQLGQGANMALLDAMALARAVAHAETIEDALARYARTRRTHVVVYQALTWLLTPLYQSDSSILPALRDHVLAPASRIPLVHKILARLVAGVLLPPIAGIPATSWMPLALARAE